MEIFGNFSRTIFCNRSGKSWMDFENKSLIIHSPNEHVNEIDSIVSFDNETELERKRPMDPVAR